MQCSAEGIKGLDVLLVLRVLSMLPRGLPRGYELACSMIYTTWWSGQDEDN